MNSVKSQKYGLTPKEIEKKKKKSYFQAKDLEKNLISIG